MLVVAVKVNMPVNGPCIPQVHFPIITLHVAQPMHKSVIIKIIRMGRGKQEWSESGGTNEKVMNESIPRARGRDGLGTAEGQD